MDIKSLVKQIVPFRSANTKEVTSQDKGLRMENEPERDADGQTGGDPGSQGRKLRDGELELVKQALGKLPGFKENNLRVEVQQEEDQLIFKIVDSLGKVVRRIPELEASKLLSTHDSIKGQIFHRAL